MSDFVFFDEDLTNESTFQKVVERLKKDVFLQGKIISEGTMFSVSSEEEDSSE